MLVSGLLLGIETFLGDLAQQQQIMSILLFACLCCMQHSILRHEPGVACLQAE